MGQKMARFGTRRDTRSRQDESIEVGEVGSKRPSSGGNGGHVVWWIGLIFRLLSPALTHSRIPYVLAGVLPLAVFEYVSHVDFVLGSERSDRLVYLPRTVNYRAAIVNDCREATYRGTDHEYPIDNGHRGHFEEHSRLHRDTSRAAHHDPSWYMTFSSNACTARTFALIAQRGVELPSYPGMRSAPGGEIGY
jgi:hypothetical protein